jgi:uncharacterized heparinase superfamily protein
VTQTRRAQLLWHTVRYLRPQQILSRVRLQALARYRRYAPARAWRRYRDAADRLDLQPKETRWKDVRQLVAETAAPADVVAARTRADWAELGRFEFLNTRCDLGRPIAWHAGGPSQLWRYHLQYGRYLVDRAATGTDSWPSVAALIREWIAANPMGRVADAWHPFVVSERLVNWMLAIRLCAPSGQVGNDILGSLAVQAVFLEDNLETDVGGNHLLKNLKAMAVAGCFWAGTQAHAWSVGYTDRFARELEGQLLSDGAHYERSPMYHCLVLEDALELASVLRTAGLTVPDHFASVIRAMVAYLPRMTHLDGEIALFNDSVFGEAPPPRALAALADRVLDDVDLGTPLSVRHAAISADLVGPRASSSPAARSRATEDGGLVWVPSLGGRGSALMDVGPACPDDLPAHAHADLFSFELMLDGARWIVDSGVGEYQAGPWREYYRSTRAHNTVAVDDEDQIECWSSFRVARRARVFAREVVESPLASGVTACHDGYSRLRMPVKVRRTVLDLDGRSWLVVDRLEGSGVHRWSSFVHAAPNIAVDCDGPSCARLTRAGRVVTIAWFGVADASIVSGQQGPLQGWYAPEFGKHLAASVLTLSGGGRVPAEFGYLIVPDLLPSELSVLRTESGLEIRLGTATYVTRHERGRISVMRAC